MLEAGVIKMRFRVYLQSALHHGSGMGSGGIIDRSVLRGANGMPYIAGSALKGKLRHAAGLIVTATSGALPHGGNVRGCCAAADACLLCRVFGSPRKEGKAYFTDAWPAEEYLAGGVGVEEMPTGEAVRTTCAIDRRRRTARGRHLFTSETVPSFVNFEFAIEGNLDASEQELIQSAATMVRYLGGGASRGLGSVRIRPVEAA